MVRTALLLVRDLLHFAALVCSSHSSLAAENLFLRKQLAFYLERKVKPRRVDDATRITLVVLARFLDWRRVLTIVQPDTLVRWHVRGFVCSGAGNHGTVGVPGFPCTCRS
jgi:putative transposase